MKHDPFGDLQDWAKVLDLLKGISGINRLAECQPGLIRILRYKGNWRLREEVLKRVGQIQTPSEQLVFQVLTILADDNIYYDARSLAGEALVKLLKNAQGEFRDEINLEVQKVAEKLRSTPQPPFFDKTLKRLHSNIVLPSMAEGS